MAERMAKKSKKEKITKNVQKKISTGHLDDSWKQSKVQEEVLQEEVKSKHLEEFKAEEEEEERDSERKVE